MKFSKGKSSASKSSENSSATSRGPSSVMASAKGSRLLWKICFELGGHYFLSTESGGCHFFNPPNDEQYLIALNSHILMKARNIKIFNVVFAGKQIVCARARDGGLRRGLYCIETEQFFWRFIDADDDEEAGDGLDDILQIKDKIYIKFVFGNRVIYKIYKIKNNYASVFDDSNFVLIKKEEVRYKH